MNSNTTTPTAAGPPPATSTGASEDQAVEGGESIATFACYQPTALPQKVIAVLNNLGTDEKEKENSNQVEVIEILDDDDDDNAMDTNDEDNMNTNPNPNHTSTITLTCPSHTSLASESALLSSVRAPCVANQAAECLMELAKSKALSPLQLEGVLLAISRHTRIYGPQKTTTICTNTNNTGIRAGFFLGDGAGVGKGRQIAGILRDSLCRTNHTRRHIWLSVSRELIVDAQRDLHDVDVHCPVHDGTDLLDSNTNKGLGASSNKGILFVTYALLVSSKRMEQIISWAANTQTLNNNQNKTQAPEHAFNGCIIFDEAHKAKNLTQDSKTAQLVIELQRRLPQARVVYCSATGVSDVKHMVYAERLGLWNTPNTTSSSNSSYNSLFPNFATFQSTLEQRGLGSLEMLALEMKQQGSFMARTLSWDGAEFDTTQVKLDLQQRLVYDQAVQWWTNLKLELTSVLNMLSSKMGNPPNRTVWRIYWSAHQRFFKELAICAKVPFIAQDAKLQREQGFCAIIGLQSTGDAGMQSILEDLKTKNNGRRSSSSSSGGNAIFLETLQFPKLLSTVASIMTNFVRNHFPVAPSPPEPPKVPAEPSPITASIGEQRHYMMLKNEAARIEALPPPAPLPELLQKQQMLMDSIKYIHLPPNPLDDLIERLGGVNQVAEMTGRSGRIVRAQAKTNNNARSYFVYSKRGGGSGNSTSSNSNDEETDRVNLVEKRKFMDGTKPFAIISDAASTGISLHAARGSGSSHKRRVHYTIELPWAADKAIQQLGRSHRSGQESAPIYKLVVTDLGGERRFAAAVSKRMQNLGALTKGDRRAATGSDMLSDFDLDSCYGKRALKRFYLAFSSNAEQPQLVLPSRNSDQILDNFVSELIKTNTNDAIVKELPSLPSGRRSMALSVACAALEDVGLGSEARKNADVKVFLNRIFGLAVANQNLIFSLFMSTLEDITREAKSTGEFEGSAEDVKATSIEISKERVLAVDPSCGAKTKLTTLTLDRGISFSSVFDMACVEASEKRGDASDLDADERVSADKDDSQPPDDDWKRKKMKNRHVVAPAGFYVSRNRIAGRQLILFAKRKYNPSSFKSEREAADFDPLGLMVITRPNTGINPCEMPTRDLNLKYRLAMSSDDLKGTLERSMTEMGRHDQSIGDNSNTHQGGSDDSVRVTESDPSDEASSTTEKSFHNEVDLDTNNVIDRASCLSPVEIVTKEKPQVVRLWNAAFEESNHFSHQNGLAPRRSELGIVTGAVLHILPALEKAVMMRSAKERSLKIVRAEVSSPAPSQHRFVGIRFPTDEDALQKLQAELDEVKKAQSSAGDAYHDEPIEPICPKSLEWATVERKTMKSFFAAVPKDATHEKNGDCTLGDRKNGTSQSFSATSRTKRPSLTTPLSKKALSSSSNKKPKTIASFFSKKT